ncbi:MAG TPA: ATP-binding protein [Dongiaceae bacterium]|nr:ATP-binding protein [Dongiaceae bacterium]
MRRFLPDSIVDWLVVIVVTGICASQLATTLFHNINRNQAIIALEDVRAAERIASIVAFLEDTAPILRPGVASAISRSSLYVAASERSAIQDGDPVDSRCARLRDVVKARLLDIHWRQVRVNYAPQPVNSSNWLARIWPEIWGSEQDRTAQILSRQSSERRFRVAVQLMDGGWLNFDVASVSSLPVASWDLIVSIILTVAVAIALSVFPVYRLTRPLARFTQAAEALGRGNLDEPVPERGSIEVRRAAHAFNDMQARIRRLVDGRTQMIAAISHDLRTPITRLRLRAEFVEDPEAQRRMLADLDEMETMIKSTLAFAREDSDREPAVMLDLVALLRDVVEDIPEAVLQPDLPARYTISGRPLALRRCFRNVIDNAIKYGKRARIGLHEEEKSVLVTVDDDGPGIPEDQRDLVFRPFYRLDASRNRDSGGTGLGLAIVQSIALSHGGEVALSNRPEGGLRVAIRLPS